MAFDFNKLKSDIVSMGKDVGDKVSDASAIAKVKLDIHNKESYMEKQFTELGRAYYLAHKNEENIPEKEFFKPIQEAEAEIARLQEQLMTFQGSEVCPNCGKKQPAGHVCCENCGAPMHETASAEEAATSSEQLQWIIVLKMNYSQLQCIIVHARKRHVSWRTKRNNIYLTESDQVSMINGVITNTIIR